MFKSNIKEIVKKYVSGGLFHIFGSSVIAQICGLVSSVVVIRFLPKAEYGYYVSANNLYSYLSIFVGMGLTSAVIQYCSENLSANRKNGIYRYSLIQGGIFNILLAAVVLGMAFIKRKSGDVVIANYLMMLCGLPFATYINSYLQVVLRTRLENKTFSSANVIYTIAVVLGNIIFTHFFGVPGLIVSIYLSDLIAAFYSAWYLQKKNFFYEIFRGSERLPIAYKKEIVNYSLLCAITNFTSNLLVLLDITCLDIVLSSPDILADYKVASTVPSACMFIPTCLITYFYPQMVRQMSDGTMAFKKYLKFLLKIFIVINCAVFIVLMIGAPLIVSLIYGEKYMNVIPLFRTLSLNYFIFASFRKLLGNTIAVIKKVKVNLIHTVLAGMLNVLLNITLITSLGSIGASIATICVTVFVVVLESLYLRSYFHKHKEAIY